MLFFVDPCSPLARLQSLQREYKVAALRAKHQDDTATAARYLRVAKVGPGPHTGPAGAGNQRQRAGPRWLLENQLFLEPQLLSSATEQGMEHPLGSWEPLSTHLILSPRALTLSWRP